MSDPISSHMHTCVKWHANCCGDLVEGGLQVESH